MFYSLYQSPAVLILGLTVFLETIIYSLQL